MLFCTKNFRLFWKKRTKQCIRYQKKPELARLRSRIGNLDVQLQA
nr:MAG TPA: A-type inclusion protein repeat protein [Caudoviricetes sp.]